MSKYIYLVKALRAYRHVSYGQFDIERQSIVKETQDAANAIENLEEENGALREQCERQSHEVNKWNKGFLVMCGAKNKAIETLKEILNKPQLLDTDTEIERLIALIYELETVK